MCLLDGIRILHTSLLPELGIIVCFLPCAVDPSCHLSITCFIPPVLNKFCIGTLPPLMRCHKLQLCMPLPCLSVLLIVLMTCRSLRMHQLPQQRMVIVVMPRQAAPALPFSLMEPIHPRAWPAAANGSAKLRALLHHHSQVILQMGAATSLTFSASCSSTA